MSACPLQRQPAQFGEGLNGCFAAVTSDAAVLHAAKWDMRLVIDGAVIHAPFAGSLVLAESRVGEDPQQGLKRPCV